MAEEGFSVTDVPEVAAVEGKLLTADAAGEVASMVLFCTEGLCVTAADRELCPFVF